MNQTTESLKRDINDIVQYVNDDATLLYFKQFMIEFIKYY